MLSKMLSKYNSFDKNAPRNQNKYIHGSKIYVIIACVLCISYMLSVITLLNKPKCVIYFRYCYIRVPKFLKIRKGKCRYCCCEVNLVGLI